ncbi:hypothetical protein KJ853_01315 [Patescibacteria group bacterium]|nr:hypothetical protein [Patescibacteria group bacterium]
MEIQNLIKKLRQLNYPEIELAKHKSQLKAALLKKAGRFLLARNEQSVFWRQIYLLKNMSLIKKAVPIGIILTVILIAVLMVNQKNSSQAQAKEVLNRAINAISLLSSEQKIEIEETIKDDPVRSLNEAAQAKDLVLVGKKEIAGDPILKAAANESNATKFIRYTNPQGQTIILGINQDNLPTMKDLRENDENKGKEGKNKDENKEKGEDSRRTTTTTPSVASPTSSFVPRPGKEDEKDKKRNMAAPTASPEKETGEN